MGKTLHRRGLRVRRTRRVRGGAKTLAEKIRDVKSKLESTPIRPDSITVMKPDSKFVVATYWWGAANVNRNLQLPCPEDITMAAKREVLRKHSAEFPSKITTLASVLQQAQEKGILSAENKALLKATQQTWDAWQKTFFESDAIKAELAAMQTTLLAAERAKDPTNMRYKDRKFPEMIKEWEATCAEAGVNFLALQTEFERSDYQAGINAKPLFIKKVLDALKAADPENPKGVLYIDGDMWVHKYPTIFDIEGVDFMARSWNTDPRAKAKSLKMPFFDPMIFETSGGTMYFGNTVGARRLLDLWAEASENPKQEGKADDRILSQVFTTRSLVLNTNIIGLPIEYLWLTDVQTFPVPGLAPDYKGIIEHPYCLTGEERAADQGAAANRTPAGYAEEIEEAVNYKRPPVLIYEYIMFNGHKEMRDEMGAYLTYLSTTNGHFSQQPLATVIPFDARYGEFTAIADANLAGLPAQAKPTGETVSIVSGSIPDILKALREGKNVWTGAGEPPKLSTEDIECYATDASNKTDDADPYTRFVQVDAKSPMYFSASSPILQHLLAMSATLADMNKHLKKSYMFLSRIRWELVKPEVPEVAAVPSNVVCAAEFPKKVHQIWFGPVENMGWRKTLFDKNKALCEKYGYEYKLWLDTDRTKPTPDGAKYPGKDMPISENYPITFPYQQTAVEKGRETGQSRWAQVADLARLELIYDSGGIYADSIIELSPALFMAIEDAVKKGYQFIGCNEDPCDPFGRGDNPCRGAGGREFLTNSFFAATRANPLFERLLDPDVLDTIDFDSEFINQTTGPYFLRTMITDPKQDRVFLLDQPQMFQFRTQATQSLPVVIDRFISADERPGSVKVKDGQYFTPGGIDVLQREHLRLPEGQELTEADYKKVVETKGPLAIYHSGLGGTWSV